MWFLIKGTFWFSLVLVLLPFLDPASSDTLQRGPKVDVGDTVSAASEAFGYISALCVQKPDVCEKGAETFVALGHRAREGARIAYLYLDDKFVSPEDAVTTGTVAGQHDDAVGRVIAAAMQPQPTLAAASADESALKRIPVPEKRIEPKTALR